MYKGRRVWMGSDYVGKGVLRAAEGVGGWAGEVVVGRWDLPSLLQALEIPQDVGDDVVFGFLIHVPDHRRQLGAVRPRSSDLGGRSRTLFSGDLQK